MANANRSDVGSTDTVGYLLNLLALKFKRSDSQTFAAAVQETRDKAYAALAHSEIPFNALLEKLAVPRSSNVTPIFQVVMDYLPHKFEPPKGLGTPKEEVVAHLNYNFYDVVLDVNDISTSMICVRLRAQSALYSRAGAQMILDAYVKLLEMFAVSDAMLPMRDVSLYDADQVETATKIGRGMFQILSVTC